MKKNTLILLLVLLFKLAEAQNSSDTPPGTIDYNHPKTNKVKPYDDEGKIAIVLMQFTKIGNQYSAAILNSKVLQSNKIIEKTSKRWNTDDLVCLLLNNDNQVLDSIYIENPYSTKVEIANQDGSYETKEVQKASNEVALKFSYSTQMRYVKVMRVEYGRKLALISVLDFIN